MIKDNVIEDLYKDIVKKRNKCKIDLDNYITEIEIIKRSIEYNSSKEDDSRFFSPRNSDSNFDTSDDLTQKMEKYEKLLEETKERFEYYDGYCTRLALLINKEIEDNEIIKEKDESEEDKSYNLILNYDIDEIKEKLLSIKNSLDLCIKIFENDKNRTKQEMKNISKSVDQIINSIM